VAAMKNITTFPSRLDIRYLSKAKKQLTIRLNEDTIVYFKALARRMGI
jgi:hypothetical protein